MSATSFLDRHWHGPGGMNMVLRLAFPMVVSSTADSLMMFTSRAFLARLGPAPLAAALMAGMLAFTTMTFFFGLVSYTNAVVAQHLGAGQKGRCAVATAQGLFVAVASFPLILATIPLGHWLFAACGHTPVQQMLERQYFDIVIFGAVFGLLRAGFSSFFAGIGRTRIVMVAAVVAMLVNIAACYVLIFGKLGCPALGMAGAAAAFVIGSAVGCAVLAWAYFGARCREEFHTTAGLRFDPAMLRLLLRYGTPSGLEFFLNMAAFSTFMMLMQSYGPTVAAAVTITFNWDLMAFIPMIGVNIATMSLVGRFLGAGDPATAERAAYAGLKAAYAYAGTLTVLFLVVPGALVAVFAGDAGNVSYAEVRPLAVAMLRLAAIYTLADATFLVCGGALRGAGDTRWAMRASVALNWLMALVTLLLVRVLHVTPLHTWAVFVGLVLVMGLLFLWRFRQGRWKELRMITPADEAEPAATPAGGG